VTSIGVVIPAYNAATTLGPTIESVLAQTRQPDVVIVVDDGSTDDTAFVAHRFEPKVRCITVENGGVSRARNTGIEAAGTDLVALLDADDLWRPEKLRQQEQALSGAPRAGLCFAATTRVDEGLRHLSEIAAVQFEDFTRALLLFSVVVSGSCSSALVSRAALLESGGFRPEFSQCADWDLWLRLSLVTEFVAVHEPLVLYRSAAGNMSSDVALLERDTFAVLDDFFSTPASGRYRGLRSRAYSNHWMILAGSYHQAGDQRAALRCALRSLALYPANALRPLGFPVRRLRQHRRSRSLVGAG
jgi:glycosyltransferase involved in cell wall biosynthesis